MAKRKKTPKTGKIRAKKGIFSSLFVRLGLASFLLVIALFTLALPQYQHTCGNSVSCIKDLSGKYEPGAKGVFLGRAVTAPKLIASDLVAKHVLGATTADKHIYVDLYDQRLYAFEGDKLMYNFLVSTGKWHPTPTGDFRIWIKLRYTRMTGGSGADYYDLPNVPYTMFFANDQVPKADGFSLHGAYWHNNFGHVMSHGCVNLRPEDAALLFAWASPTTDGATTYATAQDPGTLITIYGTPPLD